MKKRMMSTLSFALALAIVISLAACSSGSGSAAASTASSSASSTADDTVYTFKMANQVPDTDPLSLNQQYLAEILEERSGGRIKCTVYNNGEFGSSNKEQLEMVMAGTLQLTTVPGFTIAAMADDLNKFNISDYPYMFNDNEEAYKLWDSEIGQEMLDELHDVLGVYGAPAFSCGWTQLTSNVKPITSPEDVVGVKIRSSLGTIYIETLNKWGAIATPIDWGEMYTALQQGTCDGLATTTNLFLTNKFYEVLTYMATTRHGLIAHYPVYNAEFYDTLPDDLKVIFDQAIVDFVDKSRELQEKAEDEALQKLADNGMIINDLTQEQRDVWVEAAKPVWKEQASVVGEEFMDEVLTFLGKN